MAFTGPDLTIGDKIVFIIFFSTLGTGSNRCRNGFGTSGLLLVPFVGTYFGERWRWKILDIFRTSSIFSVPSDKIGSSGAELLRAPMRSVAAWVKQYVDNITGILMIVGKKITVSAMR